MSAANETIADIVAELRNKTGDMYDCTITTDEEEFHSYADRIEAAWKREREEIVGAVSELRDGMCIHCDMQLQCAEGEDGMATTCHAMAIVNNFINRYKKLEVRDECPF